MINFDDIKLLDHEEMIFLPVCLANDITVSYTHLTLPTIA